MTSPIGLEVPAGPGEPVAKHSALLAVSAGLVGVLSYLCTLLMAHLLPPAAVHAVRGGADAGRDRRDRRARPGPAAAGRAGPPARPPHRRAARGHGVRRARLGGCGRRRGPAHRWDHRGVRPVARRGGHRRRRRWCSFTVAPAQGWLQGELRFTRYAVASILEVAVRLGFSAVAVLLGWGPAGALLGFAVGGLVLVAGPLAMLRDVGWHPHVLREGVRWAETGDIALVQFVVSVLVGADVVLVALLGSGTPARGRVPGAGDAGEGPGVRGGRHGPGRLPAAAGRRAVGCSRTC